MKNISSIIDIFIRFQLYNECDLSGFIEYYISKKKGNVETGITIDFIQDKVCKYYNITKEQLHNPTRKRETVQARQIAMYFSKSLTKCSLATIGSKIGGKDHATCLWGIEQVNNLIETDKIFKLQIEEIKKMLKILYDEPNFAT